MTFGALSVIIRGDFKTSKLFQDRNTQIVKRNTNFNGTIQSVCKRLAASAHLKKKFFRGTERQLSDLKKTKKVLFSFIID